MTATTQISASLGRKLLQNADRYFTNDDATILDEMIQNARRAGASTITFTAEGSDLIIIDNGKGLPAEKAGVLLALGDSNNDDVVETAENAAGLGFFSLASFDVEVLSQNWSLTVPKAAFTGAESATLRTGQGYRTGLTIRIREFLAGKTRLIVAEMILKAARYSTLTAELIGFNHPAPIQKPVEFMAAHAGGCPHESITSHGVTVTLVRSSRALAQQTQINFFGKVITHPLFKETGIPESEKIAFLDARGHVQDDTVYNLILVDVHDTTTLKLQLPQRQALIVNRGLEIVRDMAQRAFVALLKRNGVPNGLPATDKLRRKFNDIPAPRIAVAAIDGERFISMEDELQGRNSTVPLSHAFAMNEYQISLTDGSLLRSLLSSIEPAPFASDRLFCAGDLSKAYPVDRFGMVSGIDLVITKDEEENVIRLSEASVSDGKAFFAELTMDEVETTMADADIDMQVNKVVDSLALKFVCTTSEEAEVILAHPIAGFFFTENGDTWEPTIIISKGREGSLPSMMIEGIDWYSDDAGSNSYDDQQNEHERQYTRLVAAITGNQGANFVDEVRDRVREILSSYDVAAIASAGACNLKISIDPEKFGWDAVTIEKLAA